MAKKILILGNSSAGMFHFRETLIRELCSAGNEVVISVPAGMKWEELQALGAKVIETDMERRGMNPVKDLSLLKKYATLFKAEKPDFIITYTIKPNIYGGYMAKKKKIPYAANITGLGTAFQNEGFVKSMVTIMYRTALKGADTVFFENAENCDSFLNSRICTRKQAFVLNGAGVDTEHFRQAEYPSGEPVRFLFIGRVMEEKGVNELFDAMKRLVAEGHPCVLDVLGSCEEDYQAVMERYEKQGWLRFLGYQTDVRPFIEQSHCFVLPSWHEGMANTNLEAAAMGRPVITSNIHGCLEAVEDGKTGYVCEKQNAEDLYRQMKRFLALSDEARQTMGAAGRKRAEQLFDRRVVVRTTLERLGLA